MNNTQRWIALSVVLPLAACSTYVGHKINPDGSFPQPDGKSIETGYPFQLTKPEFTLDIAPNADDATLPDYTLNVTQKPDPNQRYTLTLNPALFADSNFSLAFGKFSNLTTVNTQVTSKVASIVAALGKAAATYATLDANGGLDKLTPLAGVQDLLQSSKNPSCAAGAGKLILNRMNQLAAIGMPPTEKSAIANILTLYYPETAAERACLQAVRIDLLNGRSSGVNAEGDQKLYKDFNDSPQTDEEKAFASQVRATINLADLAALQAKLEQAKNGAQIRILQTSVAFVKEVKPRADIIWKFGNMSDAAWRARRMLDLERQLEKLKIAKMQSHDCDLPKPGASPCKKAETDAAEITQRWRNVLDIDQTFFKLDNLNAFLGTVRTTTSESGKNTRFAADEYAKIRTERDLLQDVIDKRRTQILAGNDFQDKSDTAPKVTAKKALPVTLIASGTAFNPEKSSNVGEYVLVLEPELDKKGQK